MAAPAEEEGAALAEEGAALDEEDAALDEEGAALLHVPEEPVEEGGSPATPPVPEEATSPAPSTGSRIRLRVKPRAKAKTSRAKVASKRRRAASVEDSGADELSAGAERDLSEAALAESLHAELGVGEDLEGAGGRRQPKRGARRSA